MKISVIVRKIIARATAPKPRELCFVPYAKGDELLKSNQGWRVAAREEDRNKVPGWVYLERDA